MTLQRGIAASESIFDLLDSDSEYINLKNNSNLTGNLSITFRDVSFKYPSSQTNILNQINIQINQRETIALVGKSGSGKTTLLDLIPRLYDPINGEIFFNNINIKDINLNEIRSYVSYVGQDFTLLMTLFLITLHTENSVLQVKMMFMKLLNLLMHLILLMSFQKNLKQLLVRMECYYLEDKGKE